MRFGIMSMQIDALIPPETPEGGFMEHIANFDMSDVVNDLSSDGFNLIELGGDLSVFLPHTFSPPVIERLGILKKERDLSYTVHLPQWSVEPSTPLDHVRQGAVKAIVDVIRQTDPLEPEVYVLHATGNLAAEFYRMGILGDARALLLRQFQSSALASLRTILAKTEIPSRKLAIETIEFPLDLTLELADTLDLTICLDTGHLLAGFSGSMDFSEAVDLCLPRLAEVHLHDSPAYTRTGKIGYGQDHRPLGSGDLNTGEFLDRLHENHFQGPIIFELRREEAQASLNTIKEIRPQY